MSRRKWCHLLVGLLVVSSVLHAGPAAAAGRAQVLTDDELDATYAQGLLIVNVSMNLNRIADRFDFGFAAETRIQVPDSPTGAPPSQARLDFLGGLVSIATAPDVNGSQATAPGASSAAVTSANGALAVFVESVSSGSTTASTSRGGATANTGSGVGATGAGATSTGPPTTAPAGSGVSVSFAGAGTGLGRSVVSISAVNVAVDTRVNITVGQSLGGLGSAIRSAVQTQIRSSLGARP
jgi:hypothetical protein